MVNEAHLTKLLDQLDAEAAQLDEAADKMAAGNVYRIAYGERATGIRTATTAIRALGLPAQPAKEE